MTLLQHTWGSEVLSADWSCDMGLLAGRAADALVVLLKHFRRVNSSAAAWTRFCTKLDEEQVKRMEKLRKQMAGQPEKRNLKALASEITLDSEGYPAMVAKDVVDSDEGEGEQ